MSVHTEAVARRSKVHMWPFSKGQNSCFPSWIAISQAGWKKKQTVQAASKNSLLQYCNNTVRVNTNLFLHCSTFQCTIQSPFLAWKAILLQVCLVTFQTNDLTRPSQDKCWVNKGQSAARSTARIPSKGIQLYSCYHLSGITYPFSLGKWVIAGTRARM